MCQLLPGLCLGHSSQRNVPMWAQCAAELAPKFKAGPDFQKQLSGQLCGACATWVLWRPMKSMPQRQASSLI